MKKISCLRIVKNNITTPVDNYSVVCFDFRRYLHGHKSGNKKLSRARMFTKRWLASLPSTLLKRLYDLNHVSDILTQKISKTSDFP